MNLSKTLLTLLLSAAVAGLAQAASFTNNVSVDSFVRAAAPTLNYGSAGALSVSGASAGNSSGVTNGIYDSFIRFNTAAMVTNFDSVFGSHNWVMTSAKLLVTEVGAPANAIFNRGKGAFEIRWIANDNWIEGTGTPTAATTNGIAYQDEPALLNRGTDVSLGVFTNAGTDATVSFSFALPAPFTADLKAGGEVGLYLTAIDPGIGFTFDSRGVGPVTARPALEISALPRPGIAAISLSGTDILLAGTNGVASGTYHVLASANVALPVSQWSPVATNVLSANGNFAITLTNVANANAPQQFFILQTQ
jgi:hypothetical protein